MIRLLRRSRLLALSLLLVTPALGGAWLQALHACPVDAPWAAGDEGAHAGHHGTQESAGGCHCVGTCAGVATAALAVASILPPVAEPAPAARPSYRLPPATAPPLV